MHLRSVLRNVAIEGDGGGGDPVFDDAPSAPKSKLDGALPPKPVKPKAEAIKAEPKPKPKTQAQRSERDEDASDKLAEFIAKGKEKEEKKAKRAKSEDADEGGRDDDKADSATSEKDEKKAKKSAAAKESTTSADDDDKPAPKAAKPPAKPEPKPAAEPPKRETTLEHDQALVRATQNLRNAEAQQKQLKTEKEQALAKVAELERKAAQLEKSVTRIKSSDDVLEVLHENGWTLERLVNEINEGKVKAPGQRAKLDPEAQERLDRLEAENKRLAEAEERRERERQQGERRRQFTEQVDYAKKYIANAAEDFPLLAACDWAASDIVGDVHRTSNPDMTVHAAAREKLLAQNVSSILKSASAVKALAKFAPELKDVLIEAYEIGKELEEEDEPDEVEVEEDDEDEEDEEPRRVAVKPHKRKPASRVSNESTPRPKTKGMSHDERSQYANTLLEKFIREQKAARR